jgi:hypothetical protein
MKWLIIGGCIVTLIFIYSLCVAAGRSDEQMGIK